MVGLHDMRMMRTSVYDWTDSQEQGIWIETDDKTQVRHTTEPYLYIQTPWDFTHYLKVKK